MIEINLPNKERLLLVEVPMNEKNFRFAKLIRQDFDEVIITDDSGNYYHLPRDMQRGINVSVFILGLFYPSRNEIDFEVKESWVNRVNGVEGVYWNYQNPPHRSVGATLRSYKESFLSLLQSHLPDNEYVNKKYLVLTSKIKL